MIEGPIYSIITHVDINGQYSLNVFLQENVSLYLVLPVRITRFLFHIGCTLQCNRSEAVALHPAFPPASHIPARRAGQYSGMWL